MSAAGAKKFTHLRRRQEKFYLVRRRRKFSLVVAISYYMLYCAIACTYYCPRNYMHLA